MRKAAGELGGSGGTPASPRKWALRLHIKAARSLKCSSRPKPLNCQRLRPCTIFRVPRRVRSRMLKAMRHGPSGVCSTSACPWSESENPGRIARQAQQIRKTGACYM